MGDKISHFIAVFFIFSYLCVQKLLTNTYIDMKNYSKLFRLTLAAMICLFSSSVFAVTEIHVETAGTLSTLLSTTDKELKVTGFINGTDIKYIRGLVTAGKVTSLDWTDVRIGSASPSL